MADRTVKIRYVITDDGSIRVLDQIENKVRDVGVAADRSGTQMAGGFTKAQAGLVAVSAGLVALERVAAVAGAAVGRVVGTIQELDNIGESAKAVGLTVTELSSLRLAAQQGGVSLDTLGRSVGFLSRKIAEASDENSKAAQIFRELGISAEQDLLPLLGDIGRAFDSLPDGPTKTRLAMELFGRSGAATLNVFNAQLGESIKLNAQLGATIDSQTAESVGRAADAIDRATVAWGAAGEAIAAQFAPQVELAAGHMETLALNTQLAVETDFAGWLNDVTRVATSALTVLGPLGPAIAEVVKAGVLAGTATGYLGGGSDFTDVTGGGSSDAVTPGQREFEGRLKRLREILGSRGTGAAGSGAAARDTAKAAQDATRETRELLDIWTNVDLEIQQATTNVFDLGSAIDNGLNTALTALISRDGGFNIGDLIKGAGQEIATEFAGGFLKAQLEKNKFDLAISDNFTVALPGFMKEGADAIAGIFGDAMDAITGDAATASKNVAGSFGQSFAQVGSGAANTSSVLEGLTRAGYRTGDFQVSGTGGAYQVQDAFGTRFSGPNLDATLQAAGGVGGGGVAGGAGISGAAVAGAAGGLLIALQATFAALDAVEELKGTIELGNIISTADILETGAVAAFDTVGLGGLGKAYDDIPQGARVAINTIFNPLGNIFEFMQAPTQGSQTKEGLAKALTRAGLPQQSVFNIGESGVRSKFLEVIPDAATAAAFAAAGFGSNIPGLRQPTLDDFPRGPIQTRIQEAAALRPGVDDLRTNEALALGLITTGDLRGGTLVANSLTSNLLLQGVSEREARRQVRKLAESQNVSLSSGIEEAQRLFLEGVFKDDPTTRPDEKAQQLFTAIEGLVGIFQEDIPAGVDVAALALANFTTEAGVDIAEFTDDLERALEIFGTLEAAAESGLRTGLNQSASAIGRRNALLAAGGPVNEIIRANLEARDALTENLQATLAEGVQTAIVEGIFDAVKDTPAWEALSEAIADAVTGGDLTKIPDLIADVAGAALPALEAALGGLTNLTALAGVTPSQLGARGEALRGQADDFRFGQLSPRDQQRRLTGELGGLDDQIAAINADGVITSDEALALEPLLRRRGEIGNEFLNQAGNYAPGSSQYNALVNQGLNILDTTADQYIQFGISQRTAIESNTSAVGDNTAAVRDLTREIRQGMRVTVSKDSTPRGAFDELGAQPLAMAAVSMALDEPHIQKKIRSFTRAR